MFEGLGPREFPKREDLPSSGTAPYSIQQHLQAGGEFNGSLPDKSKLVDGGEGTLWRFQDLSTGGKFKFDLGKHLAMQMYWFDLGDAADWELYHVKLNAKNEEVRFLIDSKTQNGGSNKVKKEAISRSMFIFARWDHFELEVSGATTEMSANMIVSGW